MKKIMLIVFTITISVLILSCGGGTGSITLNITDAPADASNIKNVYLTVTGIGYHEEDSDLWTDIAFDAARKFDLLSLTNGTTAMLGEFTLPAGKITQLRFYLDAKEAGEGTPANPGCYIVLDDESEHDLFVPSGGSSGYKATGAFDVPVNGSVSLTADFDVRKSLKLTAATYNLQPTIRLVADNEAGRITGTAAYTGGNELVVFAYEDGEYEAGEASADVNGDFFMNAVSSGAVAADGAYILPFLAAGTYDLFFVEINADGTYIADSEAELSDVAVISEETTVQNFTY